MVVILSFMRNTWKYLNVLTSWIRARWLIAKTVSLCSYWYVHSCIIGINDGEWFCCYILNTCMKYLNILTSWKYMKYLNILTSWKYMKYLNILTSWIRVIILVKITWNTSEFVHFPTRSLRALTFSYLRIKMIWIYCRNFKWDHFSTKKYPKVSLYFVFHDLISRHPLPHSMLEKKSFIFHLMRSFVAKKIFYFIFSFLIYRPPPSPSPIQCWREGGDLYI